MAVPDIKYCPATLAPGHATYSPAGLRKMFAGRKVSHILPFDPPHSDRQTAEQFRKNRQMLSISGVQEKLTLYLHKNKLQIAGTSQTGQYILKPMPLFEPFDRVAQLPANEHLTMQIAEQVFKIKVAGNALVFFKNGEPAYLTRRFDIQADGQKVAQEDFATLMARSPAIQGAAFKYTGSYEDMAAVMKKLVVAYPVEIERFFSLVLFNYVTLNGDAHLKNFSLQMTPNGDYILSPAYDLLNTRLHLPEDTALALSDGLFANDYQTPSFQANGFYAYDDFLEFGLRIGMQEKRLRKILDYYRQALPLIQPLIKASFLDEEAKGVYEQLLADRLSALNYSYRGEI